MKEIKLCLYCLVIHQYQNTYCNYCNYINEKEGMYYAKETLYEMCFIS